MTKEHHSAHTTPPGTTMSSTKDNWFYEHFDTAGTAFGLRLKQKLEEVQTEYQHIEMW
ncbi:MAG: spermidine synthase, partial [Alcanivorax sp.]